jgi:hypothetical protein
MTISNKSLSFNTKCNLNNEPFKNQLLESSLSKKILYYKIHLIT